MLLNGQEPATYVAITTVAIAHEGRGVDDEARGLGNHTTVGIESNGSGNTAALTDGVIR
jgi:hypothetical protein